MKNVYDTLRTWADSSLATEAETNEKWYGLRRDQDISCEMPWINALPSSESK